MVGGVVLQAQKTVAKVWSLYWRRRLAAERRLKKSKRKRAA